ncbi:hypothetical protein D3C75_688160 [compost metagenome]
MPEAARSSQEARPIRAPPAAAATVPGSDTPPEVPGGRIRPVSTERGGFLARVPISVAQVSEVTVAMTPMNKYPHSSKG